MRYSTLNSDAGVSPVVAVVMLVAIAVVLSSMTMVLTAQFLNQPESPSAGVNVDYQSDSVIRVQLDSIQNADKVTVTTALGSTYTLNSIGDSSEILNIKKEGEMTVTATSEGKTVVIQRIKPHSFNPDYTVGEGEDFSTIQAAITEAQSDSEEGEIIAVERGTYSVGSLEVDGVKVVGEKGVVISDSNSGDSSSSTVTVTGDGTFSNIRVEPNGETYAISTTGSAELVSVSYPDSASVSLSSSTVATDSNKLLGSKTGTNPLETKTKTFNSKKFTSPTKIFGDKKIKKFDLTITLNQPTKYYGNYVLFNKDSNTKMNVRKSNTFSNYYVYYTIDSQHKVPGTQASPATVRLVYESGTVKVYHDGNLVGTHDNVGVLNRIMYDPDAGSQWVIVDGTITYVAE